MGARVGVRDVAALAGVSLGSVSHYFNHPEKVSVETRERIRHAIDALGFVRNGAAGQLRHGRSSLITHLAPDISTPSFSAFNDGAIAKATAAKLSLFVASTQGDRELEDLYLSTVEQTRVGGMLVASRHPIEDRIQPIRRRGIPVVLIGQGATSPEQPSIRADDVLGGRLVGEHLAEIGRRRIAFVGGPLSFHSVVNRYSGLSEGLRGSAASVELIDTEARTVQEGARIARVIAERDPASRPDAIFCVNDLLALGILQTFADIGIRVPDDIALVGYDDTPFASASLLPLTSVHAAGSELGEMAITLLLEAMERVSEDPERRESAPPPRQVVFDPKIIVRASSAGRAASDR